jgi:zinc transport system ATP-binding protein
VAPGELCALVGRQRRRQVDACCGSPPASSTPIAGSVAIGGVDVATAPRRAAAHRGYLVEGAPLPPELGVRQYLALRARLRGLGRVDLDGALAEVGLTDRAARADRRAVQGAAPAGGVVRGQLGAPPVLLLDEPAAGLDEAERAAVRARLAAGRGARAVVWVSHELADVEAIADRSSSWSAAGWRWRGRPRCAAAAGQGPGPRLRALVAALGARA